MHDQRIRCQAEMHNGRICDEIVFPEYGGTKCICHSDDANKDRRTFQAALNAILYDETATCYDFNQFVFPADGWEFPREFDKEFYCEKAIFLGLPDFWDAVFRKHASFKNAVFRGGAHFQNAEFEESAYFNGSTFSRSAVFSGGYFGKVAGFEGVTFRGGAEFMGRQFKGVASFANARFYKTCDFSIVTFEGKVHFFIAKVYGEMDFKDSTFSEKVSFRKCHLTSKARVRFDGETKDGQPGTMFEADADFTSMRLDDGCQLTFRKIILERCLFLETRVRDVLFIGVTWPRRQTLKRKWLYRISTYRRRVKPMKIFYREGVYDDLRYDPAWVRWNLPDSSIKPPGPPNYDSVAELYRELQANYIANYNYPTAGAFYLGEQEMIRKSKHWTRRWLSLFQKVWKLTRK